MASRGRREATRGGKKGKGNPQPPPPPRPLSSSSSPSDTEVFKEPTPIIIHGQQYYKAEDIAPKATGKKKTSHIWHKGFEIIHMDKKSKHYYCRLCLDEGIDPSYVPLVVAGNSSVHSHFRSKHSLDQFGKSTLYTTA